ncbi:hypothetical protein R1flu_011169 [Riccia fluitans]|uniref:Uncharacterized protein n=1 Tax=Riccia fluitans TaxID=41844 RepID=A0ABD1ZA74_9MARC
MHQDDKHGRLDMFVPAEMILDNLLLAGIGQSRKNPVILIGQDIGGLVLKETCLRANSGPEEDEVSAAVERFFLLFHTPPWFGPRDALLGSRMSSSANEGATGEQCGNSTFE